MFINSTIKQKPLNYDIRLPNSIKQNCYKLRNRLSFIILINRLYTKLIEPSIIQQRSTHLYNPNIIYLSILLNHNHKKENLNPLYKPTYCVKQLYKNEESVEKKKIYLSTLISDIHIRKWEKGTEISFFLENHVSI